MTNTNTSTEHLDAFYKLTHALSYIGQTRNEPWEVADYQRCEKILTPLTRELAKPFRDAKIFKSEVTT